MATRVEDEVFDQSIIDNRARTVAHLFLDRVAKTPDEEAYSYPVGEDWERMTWAETAETVKKIAAGLISLGVKTEERVAIAANTRIEWVLADLGNMVGGAATTTVYATTQAEDVAFIVDDSDSKIIFAEDDDQIAKLREVRAEIPKIEKVITFDGTPDGDWIISLDDLEDLGAELLAKDPEVIDRRVAELTPDSLATIIYTSGTTGRPKGVLLPHDAWTYEAAAVDSAGLMQENEYQYLWLPLAHVFGKVLMALPLQMGHPTAVDGRVDKIVENLPVVRPTWMGAAPRIFEKVYGRISTTMKDEGGAKAALFKWASGVAREVAREHQAGRTPSGMLAVKYGIADKLVLSKVRERFGGRINYFISGAAALNADIAEWFLGLGMPILEGYGLTETSAATAVNRPHLGANVVGTVGWPVPGTEFRLGEDGELLVKGPGVMRGYKDLPEATAEALVDGWFHTGDIGEILPSGHIRITDRKKDLFKTSNGKYVAPSNIESMFKGVCPYASQLVIEGDGRKFVSALVTLDEEGIVEWAKGQGMEGADYKTIVSSDAAHDMVQEYIDELNLQLNRWEQIKKFIILKRDLSIEEGEITPSLKVKRRVVIEKFKGDLDQFYTD